MTALLAAVLLSAAPRVSAVVVYPDRAQVSRTANVACSGVSKATFERIPPSADPESLRAKVRGGALEGLTTVEVPVESAFGAEREAQDKKVRGLRFEVKKLEDQQAQAQARAALGDRFAELAASQIGSEMAEPKPNTKAWAVAFDTALDAKLTSAADLAKVRAALKDARERLSEAVARFNQLSAAAPRMERRAEALVRCEKGTATVELTYFVGGSSWAPAYEARSNEAAGSVELATYATVQQATGEDWSKVSVTLSTALPSDDATVPEIHALRVYTYERKVDRKVLVQRNEIREGAEAASGEKADKASSMRVVPQGISVQLEVPGASSVPGDGTAVRLLVGRVQLKAGFFSRAVPKLVPAVFRVADVVNTAPYPLLPGAVDAYGKSGFIGRYALERVPQGAPFHLTFGLQEELRAKRIVKEELKKQQGLFGQRNRFRYVYVFELGNYRSKPETIELTEHVPVSELNDVFVEIEKDKTTAGYEMKPDDGLARWKIKLAPGEKKQVDLAFHVDVPGSYESGGL